MKDTNKDNLQRVKLAGVIARLLRAVSTKKEGVLIEHRNLIPDYTMRLVSKGQKKQPIKTVRYFKCINNKSKGKKRIYASVGDGCTAYYMFYLDPKTVNELAEKSEPVNEVVIDLLKNKWIITDSSYQFKYLKQLLYHTLAIERNANKDNKPPSGSHLYEWTFPDAFAFSGLPVICSDMYYSIFINSFSIEKDVFNVVS